MGSWGSMRSRTFVLFMIPSIVLIFVGSWLGNQRVSSRLLEAATTEATAAVQSSAGEFAAKLGRLAQLAQATAAHVGLAGGHDDQGRSVLTDDETLYSLLEANVVAEPLVYGAAFGFAPDVLDGRDRFAPYVYQSPEGIRRLDIGAESYDYTAPEWEWYAGPASDLAPRWTAPYFDRDAGGIVMVTYAAPVMLNGRFAGVATIDVAVSAVPEELTVDLASGMRRFILDRTGAVVWDSMSEQADAIGSLSDLRGVSDQTDWIADVVQPVAGATRLPAGTLGGSSTQQALHAPIADTPWTFAAILDEGDILREVARETASWSVGGLLAFLIIGLIAWRAAGSSARRMENLAGQARSLSAADYSVRLPVVDDELGDVARALNDLAARLADRELTLQATEERRFGDLVDASPTGTLLIDEDGAVVFANAAAQHLLGGAGRDLVGRRLDALLAAQAWEQFPGGLPRAITGTRLDLGQIDLVGDDEEAITVEANLAGVGEDDSVLSVLTFRDLRQEIHAARTLAERERFLAGIFQNAGVGIVVTDPDGTIRDANVTFGEYVGHDLQSLLGTPFERLLHPDERDEGGRILAALGRGALNGFVTEHRYLREGGQTSWGETRSAALRDANDRVERVIVAVTDLTARRRANATFRAVFEHSDDGYLILRRDRVDDANGAALEIFGASTVGDLSMPLFGGQHSPELQPGGEDSATLGLQILDRAWGGTTHRGEWLVARPDGSTAPVGVTLVPIEIGDDSALLAVVHDLTQRKQFEAELVEARDAAESAARAKSDFLATMSHEIRTPMNGVIGMIDLLSQSILSPDQQRMINTTRESAFALLSIINDVLDFSKIEAGKLELERLPVSIHELVDAVTEMLGTNATNAGLGLQAVVSPDVPSAVVSDPVRLRQILFNLVGNAIKFTDSGSVTIRADVAWVDGQSTLRIAVRDSGIGMSQEQIDGLFQPFTQAESSTTRRFGGTGLGLSIVLRLVNLMGGTVTVDAVPDEGSCFTVSIPLVEAEPLDLGLPDLTGCTVIVCAGDSPENEAVIVNLNAAGTTVEEVTPSELVSLLRQRQSRPPDAVYLGSQLDPVERVRLRGSVASDPRLIGISFIAGMPAGGSLTAPDLPDTTLIAAAPLTRQALLHGVAIAVGREEAVEPSTRDTTPLPLNRDAAIEAHQLILVAEDNRTNQEVIRRQLSLLGYVADVVADGQQALEALEQTEYDILLTDCHMPRVDGFELTHAIRAATPTGARRLPIVAITANALQGEGERCLAEGMDDYLTKPLDLARLRASLTRWIGIPRQARASDLGHATAIPTPLPAKAPDAMDSTQTLATLDMSVLEGMLRGDRVTARLLMADFVPTSTEMVVSAVEALATNDEETLVRVGHTLKSSARAVGALHLGEVCDTLEQRVKAGAEPADIETLVRALHDAFEQVSKAIQTELDKAEVPQ